MVEKCIACDGQGHAPGGFLQACAPCLGTGNARVRCSQCWKFRTTSHYVGASGNIVKRCSVCRETYKNWDKKTPEQKARATTPRKGIRDDGPLRASFVLESGNTKTGPIPVTMTSANTCPKSCAFYNNGCYAEQHFVAIHWRRLSAGVGLTWSEFCAKIAALPAGQLWRHNEAGDLPGDGYRINSEQLRQLVEANAGKRGFSYTHYPLTPENVHSIRIANRRGFTISISADTHEAADAAAALGLPVVTTLALHAPEKGNKTPEGRTIVVCPATLRNEITCESCKLCAVGQRKSIVGFRAHGDRKGLITERLRQLPMFKEEPNPFAWAANA